MIMSTEPFALRMKKKKRIEYTCNVTKGCLEEYLQKIVGVNQCRYYSEDDTCFYCNHPDFPERVPYTTIKVEGGALT